MTGPAVRSTPATGPATSTDGNYASSPTASYASNPVTTYASNPATSYASTPATSYATASTPAASYAANYASSQASAPASAPVSTAAATGDYVSGEQYRYALTNFVRTSIKNPITITFPLTRPPIPHMDLDLDSLRLSHIRRSRNSGPSSKSRSGKLHGSRHA